ncbi:hypothetical protein [Polaribacter sp. M15]
MKESSRPNKRLIIILTVAMTLLFIPLIAMIFTNEVKWKIFDFVVAGFLLISTGAILEVILRKIKKVSHRALLVIIVFVALCIIWAELAVGIFGTPFAGS